MRLPTLLFALTATLALPAVAAINPENFKGVASDHLHLKETARVVHETTVGDHRLRRVTVMATIIKDTRLGQQRVGRSIVIDFTVDLTARAQASADFARRNGAMPGAQFMHEPDAPELDADGMFTAHLAPAGGRLGNVNRHAGRVVDMSKDYAASGEVFVPVAGQYSFER